MAAPALDRAGIAVAFLVAGCSASNEPAPATRAEPSAATSGEHSSAPASYVIRRGATLLHITDEPGRLFDYNAPLPPPGTPPATHPFLSGSCEGGDVPGCSEARRLLEASTSTDDFLGKLRDAGFSVQKE